MKYMCAGCFNTFERKELVEIYDDATAGKHIKEYRCKDCLKPEHRRYHKLDNN
ncbi:MAG: hypothetical protein ACTSPO_15910 [Candidatus Heimdallarchaeaceae archaeon]